MGKTVAIFGMILLTAFGLASGGVLFSGTVSLYQLESLAKLPAHKSTSVPTFVRALALMDSPFPCVSGVFRRLAAFAADVAQDSTSTIDSLRWQGLADSAVTGAISCSRRDGNLYIVKAEVALIGGKRSAAADALYLSQRLSPHEAFAIARRLLLFTQFPRNQISTLLPWMSADAAQIERLNPQFKIPVLQAFRAEDSEIARHWIVNQLEGR